MTHAHSGRPERTTPAQANTLHLTNPKMDKAAPSGKDNVPTRIPVIRPAGTDANHAPTWKFCAAALEATTAEVH